MKPGTTFVGMVDVYEIKIEYRGGDSSQPLYFATARNAIMASALDGHNRTPQKRTVMEFSDGSLLINPLIITVCAGPSEKEITEAKLLDTLTPAQRILLKIK